MKSPLLHKVFMGCCGVVVFFGAAFSLSAQEKKMISPQKALMIAQATKEVEGLFALENQRFVNCIETEVLKPCESQWVTCIEDAWVVRFSLGKTCGVEHDGRLNVTLLVDGITGKIISRFPEADYFESPAYCHDHFDCLALASAENEPPQCLNFIFGQIEGAVKKEGQCVCQKNVCTAQTKPSI